MADAVHDGFALAHTLIMSQLALPEGRQTLAEVAPLIAAFPEGGPELAYYQGLLGLQSGDLRAALRAFQLAARDAHRLGLSALEGYAETQQSPSWSGAATTGPSCPFGRSNRSACWATRAALSPAKVAATRAGSGT